MRISLSYFNSHTTFQGQQKSTDQHFSIYLLRDVCDYFDVGDFMMINPGVKIRIYEDPYNRENLLFIGTLVRVISHGASTAVVVVADDNGNESTHLIYI